MEIRKIIYRRRNQKNFNRFSDWASFWNWQKMLVMANARRARLATAYVKAAERRENRLGHSAWLVATASTRCNLCLKTGVIYTDAELLALPENETAILWYFPLARNLDGTFGKFAMLEMCNKCAEMHRFDYNVELLRATISYDVPQVTSELSEFTTNN
jgi:hypothetical protein